MYIIQSHSGNYWQGITGGDLYAWTTKPSRAKIFLTLEAAEKEVNDYFGVSFFEQFATVINVTLEQVHRWKLVDNLCT